MKILFIGSLNSFGPPRGGEEYKNQLLIERLRISNEIEIIDTFEWRSRPIVFINLFTSTIFGKFDRIILSASSNSSNTLLKLLYLFPNRQRKIVYFVVGGFFPSAVKNNQYNVRFYKNLHRIVVQSNTYKEILNLCGCNNVVVVSNFKKIPAREFLHNKIKNNSQIKFVFISNISQEKGVNDIFSACSMLDAKGYEGKYQIDFFGFVSSEFELKFLSSLTENMRYMGYLDVKNNPETSYKKLSEYDCMLFPTKYKGEGFPGVLIDSFIAGLPIIASNWNINKEIISSGDNGLLFQTGNISELAEQMIRVINSPEMLFAMSCKSSESAAFYDFDSIWQKIEDVIYI